MHNYYHILKFEKKEKKKRRTLNFKEKYPRYKIMVDLITVSI